MKRGTQQLKIVTLGEGRVGKTSLSLRFVRDEFDEGQISTVQANFLEKQININGQPVKINLWDTAGQERFRALAPIYYKDAKGAVLVYDITDQVSFERVVKWVKELKQMAGDISMIIAANKCDREPFRAVDKQQAHAYAQSVGAQHILVSAKTGKNVSELFSTLASFIIGVTPDIAAPPKRESRRGQKITFESSQRHVEMKKNADAAKKGKCCG